MASTNTRAFAAAEGPRWPGRADLTSEVLYQLSYVGRGARKGTAGRYPSGSSWRGSRSGSRASAIQTPARVNVTCVTPLGEEVASTS